MFEDDQVPSLFEFDEFNQSWSENDEQVKEISNANNQEQFPCNQEFNDEENEDILPLFNFGNLELNSIYLKSESIQDHVSQFNICEVHSNDANPAPGLSGCISNNLSTRNNESNPPKTEQNKDGDYEMKSFKVAPNASSDLAQKPHSSLKECIHDESKVKNCLNRKDVVIKSILRSMRKYYADLLQDNTQYKRKIRNVKLKHQILLASSAELSESIQGTTGYKSLPFFLASLAFPCDMRKHLTSIAKARKITPDVTAEGTDVLDIIESTLNRFSKKILKRFMTKPELCSLLLHYLGKVHNNEYAQYYQMLDEMARSSISLRKGEESIVVQILSNA